MEIKTAVRRALPLQIGFYGPQGSGKTMSALLFAAGLAGPDGRVVVIDTERGRASLYADNKRVMAALPQGYKVVELDQPYHPQRFMEALDLVEREGYKVCLIDSESDSWDGPGGCTDIAEANKGRWNKSKLANKRMKTRIALSDMHVISLFKAQEKSKIIDKAVSASGKEEILSLGVLPICEKNAFYPLLLGFSVDPKTHLATAVKYHEDLGHIFKDPKLITKDDGDRVRQWNEGGVAPEPNEQLIKRSKVSAALGMVAYQEFFSALKASEKKALASVHAENKQTAEQADKESSESLDDQIGNLQDLAEFPDPMGYEPGTPVKVQGKIYVSNAGQTGWQLRETHGNAAV